MVSSDNEPCLGLRHCEPWPLLQMMVSSDNEPCLGLRHCEPWSLLQMIMNHVSGDNEPCLGLRHCGLSCDFVNHGMSCYNVDHCLFGNKCCAVDL